MITKDFARTAGETLKYARRRMYQLYVQGGRSWDQAKAEVSEEFNSHMYDSFKYEHKVEYMEKHSKFPEGQFIDGVIDHIGSNERTRKMWEQKRQLEAQS